MGYIQPFKKRLQRSKRQKWVIFHLLKKGYNEVRGKNWLYLLHLFLFGFPK